MSTSFHDIYCNNVTIDTTVTKTASTVDQWLSDITSTHASGTLVGLDVEWRPNRGRGEDNPVATLQLCVDTNCLIFQLLHIDGDGNVPRSLKRFLSNPNFVFVGVRVKDDLDKLCDDYGLELEDEGSSSNRCVVDLRDAAADKWPSRFSRNPGLKEMAWELLRISLDKPKRVTLSDWEKEKLSYDQVRYACLDAYASYMIGVALGIRNNT